MEVGSKVLFNGFTGTVRVYQYPHPQYFITGYAEVEDSEGNLIHQGSAGVLKEIDRKSGIQAPSFRSAF